MSPTRKPTNLFFGTVMTSSVVLYNLTAGFSMSETSVRPIKTEFDGKETGSTMAIPSQKIDLCSEEHVLVQLILDQD